MPHPMEKKYGLTATELLDALSRRFRAKVALEGAVAEVHMERKLKAAKQQGAIARYVARVAEDPSMKISGHRPLYETKSGKAFCGDSLDLMAAMPEHSVDLIMTSPPTRCISRRNTGTRIKTSTCDGSCHLPRR